MTRIPRLYNRHHGNAPPEAVYIGRGSPYGNPYMTMSQQQQQQQQSGYASPHPDYAPSSFQIPVNSPSPSRVVDTAQIENDIRRVLKLDASGPPVTQSSA